MSDDAQRFCALGMEHLQRGEPEEALEMFKRATELDPENADAWCGRGKASYDLGRLENADRAFKRAVRFAQNAIRGVSRRPRWWADPKTRPYLRAIHGRGLCLFWLARYEEAARKFDRLLTLAPTDPLDVRFLLGETFFRMGELDEAIEAWLRVGDDPDALYNLGLAWFFRGEWARSVGAFRRAIFENLFLVQRITNAAGVGEVPAYTGTHYKGLDREDAALDYLDRCGDLWRGRPIIERWLRAIYEHPTVQSDIQQHLEHLRRLTQDELSAGDRARIEGENTSLRSPLRLQQDDRAIAVELLERLFRA